MTAGLEAKPRRQDLGKSGDLSDLGQIIQAMLCPNVPAVGKGRARYSPRTFGTSHTPAPILDSDGGRAGSPQRGRAGPKSGSSCSWPPTHRQAGGRQGAAASLPSTELSTGSRFLSPWQLRGGGRETETEFLRIPGRLYGGGKNKKRSGAEWAKPAPKWAHFLFAFFVPFLFQCFSLHLFLLSLNPSC